MSTGDIVFLCLWVFYFGVMFGASIYWLGLSSGRMPEHRRMALRLRLDKSRDRAERRADSRSRELLDPEWPKLKSSQTFTNGEDE
ncbi:MAG: hypothetical protein ABIJ75_07920 [Actinomycetota bacterium]